MTEEKPTGVPRPLAALHEATRRVQRDWRAHAAYGILVGVGGSLVLAPAGSWLLIQALDAAAGGSVVNTAIAPLAFSLRGLLIFALWSALLCAVVVVSAAGHAYLAGTAPGLRPTARDLFRGLVADLPRVPGRGAAKLALLAALGAPVLGAGIAGVAALLLAPLSGVDDLKRIVPRGLPVPLWMVAAGMAVLLVVFGWLYVRWSLAIPALALEGVSLTDAMGRSARRVRGSFWRIALAHLAHHLTIVLLFAVLVFLLRLGGRPVLTALFERSQADGAIGLAVLLAIFYALGGAIGIFGTARLVSLTVVHHAALGGGLARAETLTTGDSRRPRLGAAVLVAGSVAAFGATIWFAIPHVREELERATHPTSVTAHRAGPIEAPENTLAALRRAIEVGADAAEIDVQQAKDGTIAVVHDPNLARLAGVDANVWELTWPELAQLDVGSHLSPAFRGERIPTLEQMLDLARDRIKLNVELKTNKHENEAFVPDVVALLRRKDALDRCIVTSLEARFLTQVRRLEPRLRLGIIITAKVGSGSDLDVDLYSVQPLIATSDFIRRAHAAGREVHVWTVNDRPDLSRFADRAADSVITDDPHLARQVLDSRTAADGIRGAARRLFALD